MPFRSVGGKETAVTVQSAPDTTILQQIAWDEEIPLPPATGADVEPPVTPGSVNTEAVTTNRASADFSPQPFNTLQSTIISTPERDTSGSQHTSDISGWREVSPIVYTDFDHGDSGVSTSSIPASLDPSRGTISGSVKDKNATRGYWKEGQCSTAGCDYPIGHSGDCSNVAAPIQPGNPAMNTRHARKQAEQSILERIEEEELEPGGEQPEAVDQEPEHLVDPLEDSIQALLASAHTVEAEQWLPGQSGNDKNLMTFATCVDAYSATVELDDVPTHVLPTTNSKHRPQFTKYRKTSSGEKTNGPIFDVSKPVPTTISGALAQSDNWSAERGYKYAVERECGAWITQKVLLGVKEGEDTTDLHALPLRTLFSVETDKHGRFLRAKLRIYVAAHSRAVVHGEHFFDNFAQTVKWANLRTTCA